MTNSTTDSSSTSGWSSGAAVVARIRTHIADGTTDMAATGWTEPVANYLDNSRFHAELNVLRAMAVPFCPTAAVAEPGAYLARDAAGVPLVAVRGADGAVRVFRNACRHRGAAVVCGEGRAAALVCPYHGWVYQPDGALRRVPHEHGFPGLDLASNGLVAVASFERHGIVFADQGGADQSAEIDDIAGVVGADFEYAGFTSAEQPVNWKLLVETFLEGLHIRFLHHGTFFPVQYDNVNVVERSGRNSRVTFPFRNIERDFDTASPMAVRGRLTFVHHLFPNAMMVTFPGQVLMIVLDPLAVDRTAVTTYAWRERARTGNGPAVGGDPDFLTKGGAEDFAVARTIQHGMRSGANDSLRFGLFEGAIGHFHQTLDDMLAAAAPVS